MIELDEFECPAKDYFRVVFWTQFTPLLWAWAYLTVLACAAAIVFGISDNWVYAVLFSVFLGWLFVIPSYLTGRYCAYSKENNVLFQKRKMTFGDGTYHIVCEDGSEGHGPLSHFYKTEILCGYYLLYMSNLTCYPVPFSAFRCEEERTLFETEILAGKLKAKTIPWKGILIFFIISACLFALANASRPHVCC